MRFALALLLTLAACATSGSDAPRAALEKRPGPETSDGPEHDVTYQASGAAMIGAIDAYQKAHAAPARGPCEGGCPKGQYCDTRSGVSRCQNDVIPASQVPGK